MRNHTRRAFLRNTLLTSTALGCAPTLLRAQDANSRISVAVVGCGVRGRTHVAEFAGHPDCHVTYVCDPDTARAKALADQAEKRQGFRPRVVKDLRRIMEDASVDCVGVATCNHWHALASIWAMQAGKDVYVEKPLSWCVAEGRRVVQASRRYNRICQVGTQYRSDTTIRNAKRFIDEGGIGEIRVARSITYKRRSSIGPAVRGHAPDSCDYNLWAGPAPMSPITRRQFHYDWHWFWETGNGDIGNSDVHRADLCCWAIGRTQPARATISFGGRFGYVDSADTPNTQVAVHDLDGVTLVAEIRGLPSDKFPLAAGAIVYGTEGIVLLNPGGSTMCDLQGKTVRRFDGPKTDATSLGATHFGNFIEAVKTRHREKQHAEVAQGHVSAAMCHLGNNSYRLGTAASADEVLQRLQARKINEDVADLLRRTIEHVGRNGVDPAKRQLTLGPWLEFDPEKEQYIGRADADSLLTREYRKPFVVPSERELT